MPETRLIEVIGSEVKRYSMRIPALIALCLTTACTGGANHLGNPILWPIGAVSTGVENATYGAKRRKVSAHVHANFATLIGEIMAGSGSKLAQGMDLARVPNGERAALRALLKSDIAIYQGDPEALVVALMVHGV